MIGQPYGIIITTRKKTNLKAKIGVDKSPLLEHENTVSTFSTKLWKLDTISNNSTSMCCNSGGSL